MPGRPERIFMITIKHPIEFPNTYPLDRIGPLKDLLFFDIETTGFSGETSQLYLIGCTYFDGFGWELIQWFADTRQAEKELLDAFFEFLKRFKILIHFNGDRFDIPYLLKCCERLGLDYHFDDLISIDIFKKIKPYRKLLKLENMKQKSIEQFLGIARTDKYNGGQLIEVYKDYLMTHEQNLYDLLILHNEDDLKGMPSILPILNYPDFLEHPFTLSDQKIVDEPDENGHCRHLLKLTCKSFCSIPVPVKASMAPARCTMEKDQITFFVELTEGTLKHFYPDYKDYYYLPFEDRAVHKSIGSCVDKDARVKATAASCYTKTTGFFLPQFEDIWEPVMKQEYKDKMRYAALGDVYLADQAALQKYTNAILAYLKYNIH